METTTLLAEATIKINAPAETVWDAFVNPAIIQKYMFGTTVTSNWKPGSDITWKGEWQGKSYEDKGKILEMVPNKKLMYTHYSPIAGTEERPEDYHTVKVELTKDGSFTLVHLTQDNNVSEETKQHSQKNWNMMLSELKKLLEKGE